MRSLTAKWRSLTGIARVLTLMLAAWCALNLVVLYLGVSSYWEPNAQSAKEARVGVYIATMLLGFPASPLAIWAVTDFTGWAGIPIFTARASIWVFLGEWLLLVAPGALQWGLVARIVTRLTSLPAKRKRNL